MDRIERKIVNLTLPMIRRCQFSEKLTENQFSTMAFSPEEAMALMGFDDTSPKDHFSRRQDEGKNEKTDNEEELENKLTKEQELENQQPDEYTKEVPLAQYTKFLTLCRNRQFEEAITLSKAILLIDPQDKVMRQYIPVLEQHLQLQEESEEEDDDDDEEEEEGDDDEEDDDEDDDEDTNDRNRDRAEGKQDNNESKIDSTELKK